MAWAAQQTLPLPELITVSGGCSWIGSGDDEGRDEERPRHRVHLDAFRIAAYQVTNHDYGRFLEASGRTPPPFWSHPDFRAASQPVVGVSWHEAASYCEWLAAETGEPCRLPTEAEWECAARGGLDGAAYPWGSEPPEQRPGYATRWKSGPEPVGTSPPNGYGLFDIGENVHEWCLDWYDAQFYRVSAEQNPVCDRPGTSPPRRASRGGSWRHHVKISRCAARSSIPPAFQYADYGFRVVCPLSGSVSGRAAAPDAKI